MLARALPSILPPMTVAESLEVTKIYSVRGLLPPETPLLRERPFRAPHHTTSYVGLVGGGSWPRPGPAHAVGLVERLAGDAGQDGTPA